jgi:hypothetical protein
MGALVAAIGFLISPDPSSPSAFVLPFSLPIALAVAWRHGRAVAESPHFPVNRVIVASLQALVLGSLLVAAVLTVVSLPSTATLGETVRDGIGSAVGLTFLGIVFLGLPMLAIITPVIAAWAGIIRWLIPRLRGRSA